MGETPKLTRDRIEEIAREVYRCDRFTPTDEVWCNLHWLTLFAEAVERETLTEKDREIEWLTVDLAARNAEVVDLRAQLTERDREIERMKADSKTLNKLGHALGRCYCTDSGCYTAEPEALMERVQELTAKERGEWDWDLMRRERDDALAQIPASQAREREAVEQRDDYHRKACDLADYRDKLEFSLATAQADLARAREERFQLKRHLAKIATAPCATSPFADKSYKGCGFCHSCIARAALAPEQKGDMNHD